MNNSRNGFVFLSLLFGPAFHPLSFLFTYSGMWGCSSDANQLPFIVKTLHFAMVTRHNCQKVKEKSKNPCSYSTSSARGNNCPKNNVSTKTIMNNSLKKEQIKTNVTERLQHVITMSHSAQDKVVHNCKETKKD